MPTGHLVRGEHSAFAPSPDDGGARAPWFGPGNSADLVSAYHELLVRRGVAPGDLTMRAAASDLLAVGYQDRFLSRPVFLDSRDRAGLAADLRRLHELLVSLPDRLFGGSQAAMGRAVGMTPAQVDIVDRASDIAATPLAPLARADLYRSAEGFKLLELNISSSLGGFENAELNRAMLEHPVLGDFAAARQLGFVDTLRGMADTMLARCGHQARSERPVVALADWPASYVTYESRLRVMARLLAAMGIEALPCHVGRLRRRGGRIELDGRAVDIVYRIFLLDDIVTDQDAALVEPLLRAAERGEVTVFSRMDAELYGNKGALALLSDDRHRSSFTPQELACVDRLVPWTRHVRARGTAPDGSEVDLADHAVHQRKELILKPTLLHGGTGIVPGWKVPPEQWSRHIAAAMDGPYVLQRRIHPVPESFPAADRPGYDEVCLTWGVFLVDPVATDSDGYGGCFLRGTTDREAGVVSMGNGASVACCFHTTSPQPAVHDREHTP